MSALPAVSPKVGDDIRDKVITKLLEDDPENKVINYFAFLLFVYFFL